MHNKIPWLPAIAAAALALGASATTLFGTLTAFPHVRGTCEGGRATHALAAAGADKSRRPAA